MKKSFYVIMTIFFLLGCRVVGQNTITPIRIDREKLNTLLKNDGLTFLYFCSSENRDITRELKGFQRLIKIYGKYMDTSFLLLLVGKDTLGLQRIEKGVKSGKFTAYHCSEDVVFSQDITCLPSLVVVKNGKVILVHRGYPNMKTITKALESLKTLTLHKTHKASFIYIGT